MPKTTNIFSIRGQDQIGNTSRFATAVFSDFLS
jgi:hypothetical protein